MYSHGFFGDWFQAEYHTPDKSEIFDVMDVSHSLLVFFLNFTFLVFH